MGLDSAKCGALKGTRRETGRLGSRPDPVSPSSSMPRPRAAPRAGPALRSACVIDLIEELHRLVEADDAEA